MVIRPLSDININKKQQTIWINYRCLLYLTVMMMTAKSGDLIDRSDAIKIHNGTCLPVSVRWQIVHEQQLFRSFFIYFFYFVLGKYLYYTFLWPSFYWYNFGIYPGQKSMNPIGSYYSHKLYQNAVFTLPHRLYLSIRCEMICEYELWNMDMNHCVAFVYLSMRFWLYYTYIFIHIMDFPENASGMSLLIVNMKMNNE